MASLEQENERLKKKVFQLKTALEEKNKYIISLEARLNKQLEIDGVNPTGAGVDDDAEPIAPPKPRNLSTQDDGRTNQDAGAGASRNAFASASMLNSLIKKDSDCIEETRPRMPSLRPPSRSNIEMQHPLAPVEPTPPLFNRTDILESGVGTQLQGSINEDDEEDEDEEGNSSRRRLRSAKGAIKALPRELSIFNSEDDEVTRYSIGDGMPTYELEKTEMRDAYNARGLYTGTVSRAEQMPHGKGKMEYHHQGRSYHGDWHMGHWHGKGIIKNAAEDLYEGYVVNDLREGEGVLRYRDGRVFTGTFKQDEAVNGELKFPDGAKYVGNLKNGARHGYGTYHFVDGSVYEGESVMNIFDGEGKMTWPDGGWYEGEWSQGEIHGMGKEIRPDGSLRHDGQWVKGVPIRK